MNNDSSDSVASSRTPPVERVVPKTLQYGPRELRHLRALGYTVNGRISL